MVSKSKRKASKDRTQPIYFKVRMMIDAETGEEVAALVPDDWVDRRRLRDIKCRIGTQVRAVLANPRNVKFHRLVHQLGTLVRENIDGFELLTSHQVIKKLQRDSGVCCETVQLSASPVVDAILRVSEKVLGLAAARMLQAVLPEIETIDVRVPSSIAFDCMDESEFRLLWDGLSKYIVATYWPTLTPEGVEDLAKLMPYNEGL